MNRRFFIGTILVIALIAGFAEGLPQQFWGWVQTQDWSAKIAQFSLGSEEKLPGPLRGFLDGVTDTHLTASGVLVETNKQRESAGLFPLHSNTKLNQAADAKVNDMFKKQYFEHKSPDGKTPAEVITQEGYAYAMVGENLALGNFTNDAVLVQAWMNSPGHRANILNKRFEEIGISAKQDYFEGKKVWLIVQEFGTPLSSCPMPNSNLKSEIDKNRSQLASDESQLTEYKSKLDTNQFNNQMEYNTIVDKYNGLAQTINTLSNNIKQQVENYNDSVNKFNACLETGG